MSEEKEEEVKLPDPEVKKLFENVMKSGFRLVTTSKGLPKKGRGYELYNTYPTYNAFLKTQEDRVVNIMKKLSKAVGSSLRVPGQGSSTDVFVDNVIQAQDNICERAGTLVDALKKASRDEVVKVPAVITNAVSTNQKSEAEIAKRMKTFSANIGTLLAERFRERREQTMQQVVKEKPQRTYNLTIDNSHAPFLSKLKEKHHAAPKKAGLIVIDQDGSGRQEWVAEETEDEHPYIAELLNFKVPKWQLEPSEPRMFKKLEKTTLTIVDDEDKLKELVKKLNRLEEFAVDLEHNDKRSYQGITCLVQISTRDEDFIIDPFPVWNHMHLLNEPFTNPHILKVLHGADNDVQWLQRDFGIHVVNLFDTYHAMKKLRFPKFSLAYLVSRFASVELDKQYQLADWRLRPLRQEMLNYAREDTHYLLYCYDTLKKHLLESDEASLQEVYNDSTTTAQQIYKKPMFNPKGYLTEIKFRFAMNNRQDLAMMELYRWRDNLAREQDESTHHVLPDHMLLSLAEALPRDLSGVYSCCNPLPVAVKENLGAILKIIQDARDVPLIKKAPMSSAELDEVHESRGIINHRIDELTAVLRLKIDFSHSNYNEERGELKIDMNENPLYIKHRPEDDTYLQVLTQDDESGGNVMIVGVEGLSKNTELAENVKKQLETWATPYECYTLAIKEKEKQEAKAREEEEARKKAEGEQEKKFFSHHDPTVCRKPVFSDAIVNQEELKLIATKEEVPDEVPEGVYNPQRFNEEELLSKKALKRKRQHVRKAADMSVVLGESASKNDDEAPPAKKSKTPEPVEQFDYSAMNLEEFDSAKDHGKNFDPFAGKKTRGGKTNVRRGNRKANHRTGTFNMGPKKN